MRLLERSMRTGWNEAGRRDWTGRGHDGKLLTPRQPQGSCGYQSDDNLKSGIMPDRKIWDVVVVGDLFIDEVLSDFNSLPKLGEEAFARKFRREIGGGAANTACGLAKLGWRVAALGVVGKEDGYWVVRRLIEAGVETAFLENHPDESTGLPVSVSTREDR